MKLSIVILNFNTNDLTLKCIDSITRNTKDLNYEIIVVDNGSQDLFKSKKTKIIRSEINLGFAKGNNLAREICKGEYVLFLNSDTEVYEGTLREAVRYLDANKSVGALTCKMIMANGKLDPDARRSFPTPWVSLTHFSGLDKLFPKSKIFARYWYGYKSADETQEIEVFQGAFFMVRKEILDKVDWFSEDYFLDGEDIDLSWKISHLGYKMVYYPKISILHIKKASKKTPRRQGYAGRGKFVLAGMDSMEIFYKKYLWEKYPLLLNIVVIFGIYILKILRYGKVVFRS